MWEQIKIVLALLLCPATMVRSGDYDADGAVVPALLPLRSRQVRNPALESFVPPPSGRVFSARLKGGSGGRSSHFDVFVVLK